LQKGHAPTEAQSRCSRREADSNPAHRGFQIHQNHFSQLFAVLKIRRKNALAEHIIMNFKTKAAQAQIQAFYNGPWLDIPFQSIDTSFVFPLTHDIADELERVGGEILGGVNKSKTFRVMVAYFAAVHKLKTPTRPTSV
jgi:hypothetical protein